MNEKEASAEMVHFFPNLKKKKKKQNKQTKEKHLKLKAWGFCIEWIYK